MRRISSNGPARSASISAHRSRALSRSSSRRASTRAAIAVRLAGGLGARPTSALVIAVAALVEIGDHLVDAQLRRGDALPAHRDQLSRAGDAVSEAIDVDIGALELPQDLVELVECLGVAQTTCGRRA